MYMYVYSLVADRSIAGYIVDEHAGMTYNRLTCNYLWLWILSSDATESFQLRFQNYTCTCI